MCTRVCLSGICRLEEESAAKAQLEKKRRELEGQIADLNEDLDMERSTRGDAEKKSKQLELVRSLLLFHPFNPFSAKGVRKIEIFLSLAELKFFIAQLYIRGSLQMMALWKDIMARQPAGKRKCSENSLPLEGD